MRRLPLAAFSFLLAALAGCSVGAVAPPPASAARVADFTLSDVTTDQPVSLSEFKAKKAVVVVFLGTECPINNAYMPRLAELAQRLRGQGRRIPRHQQQSPGHARRASPPTPGSTICRSPCCKDAGNVVADQFGAKRTPEAFVLDARRPTSCTRAASTTSSASATSRKGPTCRDLADALDEVLAGKPVRSRPPRRPAASSPAP